MLALSRVHIFAFGLVVALASLRVILVVPAAESTG